ncbi:hypothetical protein P3L51_05540 [Streptomyces sp. PSRA5]|uniref:hypothetical protein n=1 Tax=Streptomyces panacea TaxID=3035064 RepID=UPI00339C6D0F
MRRDGPGGGHVIDLAVELRGPAFVTTTTNSGAAKLDQTADQATPSSQPPAA